MPIGLPMMTPTQSQWRLSEQRKREVVQLWLVHDHSGELVPDTLEAIEPSQAKKSKKHSEDLVFGNVTYFGTRVQDWIWT